MRKNRIMRLASAILVLTLATTCAISSTFAKYTTSANGSDSARVAKWGFSQTASIGLTDLFKNTYDNSVTGSSNAKVIAPGTEGSSTFQFAYNDATNKPEVKYTVTVSTDGSSIAEDIENNKDIVWALDDNTTYSTWDDLLSNIAKLSGSDSATVDTDDANNVVGEKTYEAGTLPDAFTNGKTHTVYWKWNFEGNNNTYGDTNQSQDEYDTAMGNKTTLDDVTLKITITATQVD